MLRSFIQNVFCLGPRGALSSEERQELGAGLPRSSLRRCSDLGILMATAMDALAIQENDPIVFLSKGSEARALEAYLESFPTPSPTRFQTSVHPGSIQQVRVARQAPIADYTPMIGDACLPLVGLRTVLFKEPGGCVVLGGEEQCGWLDRYDMGSTEAFVFGFRLSSEEVGCLGEVAFSFDAVRVTEDVRLPQFFRAIRDRLPLQLAHPDIGQIQLKWR